MKHFLSFAVLFTTSIVGAQEAARPAAEPGPLGTRLIDLDGDGDLDLLALHADGALAVRLNVGQRRFMTVPQELPRVQVSDVLCSDLDGDGQLDLYLVSPGADVALLGEGGGRFRAATDELGLVESGIGLSAERLDVDGDGLEDLLLHNRGSDVLFWAGVDGRFEREARTPEGAAGFLATQEVLGDQVTRGPDSTASSASAPRGSRSLAGVPASNGGRSNAVAGPVGGAGAIAPLFPTNILDPIYVNDNAGEVDSADIADGSLTGADVSTSSGDVTLGGPLTLLTVARVVATVRVTAPEGVFGGNSSAAGSRATVSGGLDNNAPGNYSTVAGGRFNQATQDYSTVSGGDGNTASGGPGFSEGRATVSGGAYNTASGTSSTVPGGSHNTAMGGYSFAAGRRAKANHAGSFVWGDSADVDKSSSAIDEFSVYAEGGARIFAVGTTTPSLAVDGSGAVSISGTVTANQGVFGSSSSTSGADATLSGGNGNTISGTGPANTIGGGKDNTVSGSGYSVVAGGRNNTATRGFTPGYAGATVGGGVSNQATNIGTTVGGGENNVASGYNATVPGGTFNTASGKASFAAGRRAKATHDGSFVWGDQTAVDKTSSASQQFNVYASGGTRIFSNSAASSGVLLAPGGGSWTSVSDRNAKENFTAVDGEEILERLVGIPISTWNYKSQDDGIRHMGPMAQDFWAAFALGLGDTSIDTIDPDGVALAAIQGLHGMVEEQRAQIEALRSEVENLKAVSAE